MAIDLHVCFNVAQDTQVSHAGSECSDRQHCFHITTRSPASASRHLYELSAQSEDDLKKWWEGLQQNMLDIGMTFCSAFWKG